MNNRKILRVVLLFLIIITILTSNSNADNWEYKLIHKLLDVYDPSIRPSSHHNITLNITFGLSLAQLIDVVCKCFYCQFH